MDFSFLRKLLPGLIPLVIFIIADELWGTETGLTSFNAAFIKKYVWESEREKELVFSFICFSDAVPQIDTVEAVDGRFWSPAEIEQNLGKGIFTQNFENEYQIIKEKLVK
jgi:hypothetical protein